MPRKTSAIWNQCYVVGFVTTIEHRQFNLKNCIGRTAKESGARQYAIKVLSLCWTSHFDEKARSMVWVFHLVARFIGNETGQTSHKHSVRTHMCVFGSKPTFCVCSIVRSIYISTCQHQGRSVTKTPMRCFDNTDCLRAQLLAIIYLILFGLKKCMRKCSIKWQSKHWRWREVCSCWADSEPPGSLYCLYPVYLYNNPAAQAEECERDGVESSQKLSSNDGNTHYENGP